jgi:molybdenum cofactor cytidylyltransferase
LSGLVVIVLAAGASRRLGQPKQLLSVGGTPLVRRAAELALSLPAAAVAVVLGAYLERIRPVLEGVPAEVLLNPDWAEGLAASVRLGVRFAEEKGADAALFLLVDQPFVTGTLLSQLLDTYHQTGQPLVACDYGNEQGVPLLVARRFFGELAQLRGDRGARALLRQYPDQVATVTFPEGLQDLDTPEDWERLRPLLGA